MIISRLFEHFLADIRFGLRNLGKSPSFTAMAIGSLALGIGGSTAMYSVIHAVILDPFPYRDPARLMSVTVQSPRGGNWSFYPIDQFLDIAERNTVFDGVIASTWSDVTWTGQGEPRRLRGNHCTMNTFEVMGVPPLLGRTTTAGDAVEGAEPVTVLGYRFWRGQFGADPGIIGTKLRLNDKLRTVIGVMPPRFMWRGADVYLPDVFHRGETVEGERAVHLMARLKPGVTRQQAVAALDPIFRDIERLNPDDFPKGWKLRLQDFGETFPSGIQDALWILFGAVGLLLLISCVNVSNLLLSRAAYRRREIAVRAAIGAQRSRLIRQLLAESLLLSAGGALMGIVVAAAGLRGIIAMVPSNTIPDEAQIALNMPVLLFTLAVSITAAFCFGLAPALNLSGGDILTPLREGGRGTAGGMRQRVLRGSLVVCEVALSLMLLVGASLMVRTLLSIQGKNIGFDPDTILTVRVPPSEQRYASAARRAALFREALQRIRTVPGVRAASINWGLPPVFTPGWPVSIVGSNLTESRRVLLHQTDQHYLEVLGTPLLQGRFLESQDVNSSAHSAVVNQTFVRRYFAGVGAIGHLVRIPSFREAPWSLADDSFLIVGIVADTVNQVSSNEIWPELYVPFTVLNRADRIFVRGAGRAEALDKAVKAEIYATDPAQPVMDDQSMAALLRENAYARPRFNLLLFTVFATLGLVVALFGIYGVISHSVAQQTREIGIRIALGATFRQVVGMVLSSGARLLAIGIGIGLGASLASVKVLSGLVRNVSTFDPYSFAAVTLLLLAAGLFASYWPARRAARVDPLRALRDE
ncbi:MAG TPA: ABC transporter permease [Candidatus Acidoferrales bacterium]|nr:ABC transporter permease [Candidatus Acidoferrales bacterium]